jgi:hypothetical protein
MPAIKSCSIALAVSLAVVSANTSHAALSPSPSTQWQTSLGGRDDDMAFSVQEAPDGGFVIAGLTESDDGDVSGNHGRIDFWVVKLSPGGSLRWQKCLGGTGYDEAQSIQPTSDGGYVVAGFSESNDGDVSGNHGSGDFWVAKLSQDGSLEWQKTLGGSGVDVANSIQQASDEGYVVAGRSDSKDGDVSANHGSFDYWVVKLSPDGALEWEKSLGGFFDDEANSIQQTYDGGYIVAGGSSSRDGDLVTRNGTSTDYWVVKLSPDGALQWQKALGGRGRDQAKSIRQTPDGGYVVAGFSESFHLEPEKQGHVGDYWVVKLSPQGLIQWQRTLGGTGIDLALSIQPTSDGGFIVAGHSESDDGDVSGHHWARINDVWVVKLGY